MAIVVDQKRLGGGSRSTVGTITDIYIVLRLLYSRIGQPYVGNYNVFSFNDPQGMCPECNGMGRKTIAADMDAFLDTSRSLNEGAILFPEYAVNNWGWNICAQSGLLDMDKKLAEYTDKEMDLLLHGQPQKVKIRVGASRSTSPLRGLSTSSRESTSVAM
jgi:excinuclease UvrABC ATPase subunit